MLDIHSPSSISSVRVFFTQLKMYREPSFPSVRVFFTHLKMYWEPSFPSVRVIFTKFYEVKIVSRTLIHHSKYLCSSVSSSVFHAVQRSEKCIENPHSKFKIQHSTFFRSLFSILYSLFSNLLQFHHFPKPIGRSEKFIKVPLTDYFSFIHKVDYIRIFDGRESVSNDEYGVITF